MPPIAPLFLAPKSSLLPSACAPFCCLQAEGEAGGFKTSQPIEALFCSSC